MRFVLVFIALITMGLAAAVGCGESVPTPTPTPTLEETYLKSVQRWAYFLEFALSDQDIYREAAFDPSVVNEAATMDPLKELRPGWMSNFDTMINLLDVIYLDPDRHFSFDGIPVPEFQEDAEHIQDQLRIMIKEYAIWKADPYGNADAFRRLKGAHSAAHFSASKLNIDAIRASNTGDY